MQQRLPEPQTHARRLQVQVAIGVLQQCANLCTCLPGVGCDRIRCRQSTPNDVHAIDGQFVPWAAPRVVLLALMMYLSPPCASMTSSALNMHDQSSLALHQELHGHRGVPLGVTSHCHAPGTRASTSIAVHVGTRDRAGRFSRVAARWERAVAPHRVGPSSWPSPSNCTSGSSTHLSPSDHISSLFSTQRHPIVPCAGGRPMPLRPNAQHLLLAPNWRRQWLP